MNVAYESTQANTDASRSEGERGILSDSPHYPARQLTKRNFITLVYRSFENNFDHSIIKIAERIGMKSLARNSRCFPKFKLLNYYKYNRTPILALSC